MNNMVTGLDFGNEISSSEGAIGGGGGVGANTNTKYFKIEEGKDHFIRVVSGFVPFYSYYIPGEVSRISPLTLTFTHDIQTPNGIVKQPIYLQDNGYPHPPEDAYCPLKAQDKKPIIRYATNIIDWGAYMDNPNQIPNIWILSGGISIFKWFRDFRNKMRDYPVWDFDRGPFWNIKKVRTAQGKIEYTVDRMDAAPLPPILQEALLHEKITPQDPGPWNLRKEFHPFKCSKKLAIDNGRNPLFFPDTQQQQDVLTNSLQTSGVSVVSNFNQQPGQGVNVQPPQTVNVNTQAVPSGYNQNVQTNVPPPPSANINIPNVNTPQPQGQQQSGFTQGYTQAQPQGTPVETMEKQIQPTIREETFVPTDWNQTLKAFGN